MDYYYDRPDIESGRCFFDDKDNRHTTFYRLNERTPYIGDYDCDMIELQRERLVIERHVRVSELLCFKEMEPDQFLKIEKIAMMSITAVSAVMEQTKEELSKRHFRQLDRYRKNNKQPE